MNIPAQSAPVSKEKAARSLIIRTTLYDFMSAISAEVGADDDDLAVAVAVHLLKTHRLTYVRRPNFVARLPIKANACGTAATQRFQPPAVNGWRAVRLGFGLAGLGLLPHPCLRAPIRGHPRTSNTGSQLSRVHPPGSCDRGGVMSQNG